VVAAEAVGAMVAVKAVAGIRMVPPNVHAKTILSIIHGASR
jgi:hypothetical protein